MEIEILGKKVTLKRTMRSLIIYEQKTGKTFQPKSVTDVMYYFYACILASDRSLSITFDEFMDWLDDGHMESFIDFSQWLTGQLKNEEAFLALKAEEKTAKKAKPQGRK